MNFLKGFAGRVLAMALVAIGLLMIFSAVISCAVNPDNTAVGWVTGIIGLVLIALAATTNSWARRKM